ncbi:hypothetical protein Tcan_00703, partial [Toxocara canis]
MRKVYSRCAFLYALSDSMTERMLSRIPYIYEVSRLKTIRIQVARLCTDFKKIQFHEISLLESLIIPPGFRFVQFFKFLSSMILLLATISSVYSEYICPIVRSLHLSKFLLVFTSSKLYNF